MSYVQYKHRSALHSAHWTLSCQSVYPFTGSCRTVCRGPLASTAGSYILGPSFAMVYAIANYVLRGFMRIKVKKEITAILSLYHSFTLDEAEVSAILGWLDFAFCHFVFKKI